MLRGVGMVQMYRCECCGVDTAIAHKTKVKFRASEVCLCTHCLNALVIFLFRKFDVTSDMYEEFIRERNSRKSG